MKISERLVEINTLLSQYEEDLNNPMFTDDEKENIKKQMFDLKKESEKLQEKRKEIIEKKKEESNQSIVLTKEQQAIVSNFYEQTDFKHQKDFLDVLIKSKQLPEHVKSVETAFTIAQMGKELNIPIMQALHNIIPIGNKLTLTAKLQSAILKRHEDKIRYSTLKDAVYVFNIDGEIKESQFPLFKDIETHKKHFVCRMTSIEVTRLYAPNIFYPQGEKRTEIITYTTIDAEKAELLTKSNWIKLLRSMLYARCMNEIGTRVAPDLTLGLMTTEVFADHTTSKIKYDDDGNFTSFENI